MTALEWLRARIDGVRARMAGSARRTILPPEPYDEAAERIELAIRRTVAETRMLRIDGSDLAERIRRNTRAGRDALEGKS